MDIDLEKATQRIVREFAVDEVVAEIVNDSTESSKFISALQDISKLGEIKVGGRRIRSLLGCKTIDVASDVVNDAYALDPIQNLRLGPLVQILKEFPEERMSNPDLDFFTQGVPLSQIRDTFAKLDFNVKLNIASGGVEIVEVKSSKGSATFIDANQSWQTRPPWPMYSVLATLDPQQPNKFKLDVGHGRLYEYPLEFSGSERVTKDPIDPKRFAAVGRVLLWSVTSTTPDGGRLPIPCDESRGVIYETVANLFTVLYAIKLDPSLKKVYSSGIRDMALALRIIELTDWEELSRISKNFSQEEKDFMHQISANWWIGKGMLKEKVEGAI